MIQNHFQIKFFYHKQKILNHLLILFQHHLNVMIVKNMMDYFNVAIVINIYVFDVVINIIKKLHMKLNIYMN